MSSWTEAGDIAVFAGTFASSHLTVPRLVVASHDDARSDRSGIGRRVEVAERVLHEVAPREASHAADVQTIVAFVMEAEPCRS
jgi:hypothetical protein